MRSVLSTTTFLSLASLALGANYTLVQDYSGSGFFSGWDFYGHYDNLTNGDTTYVDQTNSSSLAYVDSNGRAIVKVDNTTFVPYNEKRNSVRITTKDYFEVGTIWVIDAAHLPWGCSVWPSIWTKGNNWPDNGEIDIIEGVNRMTYNQMALHTQEGCTAATGVTQTGQAGSSNCTEGAGCTVIEKTPNSYGPDFNDNGGGVWATQFDVTGIYIWYWGRANIPASITTATDSIDISTWGTPSAAYPSSSCDIPKFFGAQQLVLNIALCGDWAGVASVYQSTCGGSGAADQCYINNVINNGTSDYAQAYFELNYIRAFGVNSSVVVDATGSQVTATATGSSGQIFPTQSGSSGNSGSNGAVAIVPALLTGAVGLLGTAAWFAML